MYVDSAIKLISTMVYKPGWSFEATDHTNRFEGTVHVKVHYTALNSNRDQAELGYPETIETYAQFAFHVLECDEADICRHMLDAIVAIETHEAREFLRLLPTFESPFHPHRVDGMKRWGALETDLQFGLA
jgi:hypothetical protein